MNTEITKISLDASALDNEEIYALKNKFKSQVHLASVHCVLDTKKYLWSEKLDSNAWNIYFYFDKSFECCSTAL